VEQISKVFQFGTNSVRTILKNNEPWFVAKDVCDVLELTNPTVAISRLDEDEVTKLNLGGLSGESNLVNEAGLYTLILGSRKPEAKQFKRWITHEVLPMIRQTGGYVSNDEMFVNTYLPFADDHTKLMFRATLETVRKQNEQLTIMQPKADYFDALVDRNLLTNFRDTAKGIQIKEKDFINWLLENKFIYRDQKGKLKPYSQYVPQFFQLKEWERNGKADTQTLITPKGKETFRLLIPKKVS
jgi:prophage antirepressor-like protein